MRRLTLWMSLATLCLSCGKQQHEDEFLWEYYRTFQVRPAKMLEMKARATNAQVADFVGGLYYLERYDFDTANLIAHVDTAKASFDKMVAAYPTDYKGYLGLGMCFTEYGDVVSNDSAKRQSLFQTAFGHYEKAYSLRPDLVAIQYYWGRALFYKDQKRIDSTAIAKLEQVVRARPDFFKAHERIAQFLSHYKNASTSFDYPAINVDILNGVFPDIDDRVRYHFNESLAGDSTWYQTYQGIADARGTYTIYERVHYLNTAIAIARSQQSSDTTALLQKRISIFVKNLSNHDMTMAELVKWPKLDREPMELLAEAYFYQRGFNADNADSTRALLERRQDKNSFWLSLATADTKKVADVYDQFIKTETDSSFRAKLMFERAKELWKKGDKKAALAALHSLEKGTDESMAYRAGILAAYIEKSK